MACFGSAYFDTEEERPDWEVGDLTKFLATVGVSNLEEDEDEDSEPSALSSSASPPPTPPRQGGRPPHVISTSASE